jgi:hypothetical protein
VGSSYTLRQEGPPKSEHVRSVPLIDPAMGPLDRLSRRELFTAPDDLVFAGVLGVTSMGRRCARASRLRPADHLSCWGGGCIS